MGGAVMPNKVRMKIGGIEYSVTSEESPEYIKTLGNEVEHRINDVLKKSPFLSAAMAAVMAALECLDECKKTQNECEKLRLEIKKLLEESAMSKVDAQLYKHRCEELKQEIINLQAGAQRGEHDGAETQELSRAQSVTQKPQTEDGKAENISVFDDLPF